MKTEKQKEYEAKFIRSLEVGLMCIGNIYYRFTEEKKLKNPPMAIITEKELLDAHKALFFVYEQTCNDFKIKIKSFGEINDSFQSLAANV
jgi:hypothetical protein